LALLGESADMYFKPYDILILDSWSYTILNTLCVL